MRGFSPLRLYVASYAVPYIRMVMIIYNYVQLFIKLNLNKYQLLFDSRSEFVVLARPYN